MMADDKIEITLKKKKSFLAIFGAIVFVLFGIFAFLMEEEYSFGTVFMYIVSIGFFGLCVYFGFKRLAGKNIGLIIDSSGITDNSSDEAVGHIPWKNIIKIESFLIYGQKILVIIVNNPDEFINREKNPVLRTAYKTNYKMCGSPISISTNIWNCKGNELEKILKDQLKKWKNATN
jgi:hypothetical protein